MVAPSRGTVFGRTSVPHTIVIARGDKVRHWTVRPWLLATGLGIAGIAAASLLASTALFLSSDRVSDALRSREAASVTAYERRIANLRDELDRVTTRQHFDRDAVSREIRDLMEQQRELTERFDMLGPLLRKAEDEGLVSPPSPSGDERRAATEPSALPAPIGDLAHLADDMLPALRRSVDMIGEQQSTQVGALAADAQAKARKIADLLGGLGVASPATEAVGGPFVADGDGFADSIGQLDQALDLIERLRRRSADLPLGPPLPGADQSSSFGVRIDPFLGRRALHTGVDFVARTGATVRAVAGGTVRSAGDAGGYGLMVEVDHGNGLATRYGHLSRIDVAVGDRLEAGQRVGAVGSTGRSTGPHLHYEVRRNGEAVNPRRYIDAGARLAELR